MGLTLNNIPNTYLSRTAKNSEVYRSKNKKLQTIIDEVKNLNWQDLSFNIIGDQIARTRFQLKLPLHIIALIKDFKDTFPEVSQLTDEVVGKWCQLNDSFPIEMETEGVAGFKRSHFPNNGLPTIFRSTGLGYKTYRRLLEETSYLRSDSSGTEMKNTAWASLIKSRPDPDDVHVILGPKSVFAITKTLLPENKVELLRSYLFSHHINLEELDETNFAIDDDLKAVIPEDLLKLVNNPQDREGIIKIKRDVEVARLREAEMLALNANRGLLIKFGIPEVDTNWQVGDFVFRYTYITDSTAKIRIIVNYNGIKALSIGDFIKLTITGVVDDSMPIRIPDNITWSKVNIASIPNLDEVRLSTAEKIFVKSLIARNKTQAPDYRNGQVHSIATLNPSMSQYGPLIRLHDTLEFKNLIASRILSPETKRKLIQGTFVSKILLSPMQTERFNNLLCTEVFVPFNGVSNDMRKPHTDEMGTKALNTITGFVYNTPAYPNFVEKRLTQVNNRQQIAVGEMIYIANHPEYFGLVAQAGVSVVLANGNEYVMVQIFNSELGSDGRKVSISIRDVRKIN